MVEVKGLSFKYSPSGPDILRDVSFAIEDGQCAAVLGNNGAGKTTLLKCIDRILQPGAGEVRVDGDNVLSLGRRELAKRVAYVAQNARAADMTVYDTVLLGRRPYIGWDATEHDREVVAEVMELMGVTPLALRSLAELSGGEAQKVMGPRPGAGAAPAAVGRADKQSRPPQPARSPAYRPPSGKREKYQRLRHPARPEPGHTLL